MSALLDTATGTGLAIFALGALAALIASVLFVVGKISDLIGTTRLLLAAVALVVRDRDRVRAQSKRMWPE